MDDIIITGNDPQFIQTLIHYLSTVFEMKDLGPLNYFLGLQIHNTTTGISINQHKYLQDLLVKAQMHESKPCKTPSAVSTKLCKIDGSPLSDPTPYRSIVGALQYLTFTRPDITYAVNHVCQFMHCPTDVHYAAVKRILCYLNGTPSLGLHYSRNSLQLLAFSNADWAGDPYDRRSTSGCLVFLGSDPICWSSKKQHTVARSSTEAEYRAMANTAVELAWLRMLLRDLHVPLFYPPTIYYDNISALSLASNPVFHARTKHIEIDYHFVRERVVRTDLEVHFVSSVDQLADFLTKGLSSSKFL